MRFRSNPLASAFANRKSTAEIVEQNAEAALFRCLRAIVLWPILTIDLFLFKRECLLLNHGPVREDVAFVDDGRGEIVLTDISAVSVVKAGTRLRFQINVIASRFAVVRLAGHEPSAVAQTIEATGRGDNQASLFAWRHIAP